MAIAMTYDKPTAIRIRDFLVRQGMTIEGAYGMMANLYVESGFRSDNAQNSYMNKMGMTDEMYMVQVDNGTYKNFATDRVGWGTCQWTSSGRKQALYNFAKNLGTSIGDESMQLNYLMYELSTSYKAVLNKLKTSHDIAECAKYVMLNFERPANQSEANQNTRASYGLQLYEELEKGENKVATKRIGLDAGHSMYTTGKQTPNGIKEWTLNDKVRDKIVALLKDYDVEFVLTDNNEGVVDESLTTRRKMYLNQKVDAFVSIHHNAYTGTWNSATGVCVYTDVNATTKDLTLANAILGRLSTYTGLRNRGLQKANFTVIYQNTIPAVLVEGGFMDSSNDYNVITSDAGQTAYARAVAEGLIEFLGLTPKTATSTPSVNISVNQFVPTMGDTTDFANIVKNLKLALNTDYGLAFDTTSSAIDDILLINLGNVALSTTSYLPNITYVLQQLFTWWGYPNITLDGIYGSGTQSTVALFQSQVGIAQTGTTTKEFWYKILGK